MLGRWRALDRVTVCPLRIGTIAAAALVVTLLDRGTRLEEPGIVVGSPYWVSP